MLQNYVACLRSAGLRIHTQYAWEGRQENKRRTKLCQRPCLRLCHVDFINYSVETVINRTVVRLEDDLPENGVIRIQQSPCVPQREMVHATCELAPRPR